MALMRMNIRVTARHTDLTPDLKDYVEERVSRLGRYFDRVDEAHVVTRDEVARMLPEGFLDKEEFLAGPVESVTWKGGVYAVPWFTDAGVLYYRKDLLEDAGVDVPETWDEFVNVLDTLKENDLIPIIHLQDPDMDDHYEYMFTLTQATNIFTIN